MTVVYNVPTMSARQAVLRDQVDAGAGPGALVIGTSALSGATGVLATIPLTKPCGIVAAGVLTFSGFPRAATATATGTAAKAEIRDASGNVVTGGITVGADNADIVISDTAIVVGQTVTVSGLSDTHG